MRKDEYIQEVISRIENKKAKAEVKREISAHIDDRISYYTDAGYDEETANEKAMEHMGDPKDVAIKLCMIHKGFGRIVPLLLLLVAIAIGAYIEIVEQLITVDLFSVSIFITEDLSVEMSNLLVTINSVLLYSALFLLSLLGGFVKKGFLKLAMGMEFYLAFRSIFGIAFFGFHLIGCFIIPFIFLILSFVLLFSIEKSEAILRGVEFKRHIFKTLAICGGITVVLYFVSILGTFAVDGIYQYEQAHIVPETYESFTEDLNLPSEIADETLVEDIKISDYGNVKEIPGYASWEIDYDCLTADFKLPERFNTATDTYYIDSNHPGFLYCVHFDEEDDGWGQWADWYINNEYDYPDLETDEISKISIFGYDGTDEVELTDLITGDERTELIDVVNPGPTGEYIFLNAFEKHLTYEKVGFYTHINWYFKDAYAIYLSKGDLYINDDDECFVSPEVETTYNTKGFKSDKEGLVSNGTMYKLKDDAAKELNKRIKKAIKGSK